MKKILFMVLSVFAIVQVNAEMGQEQRKLLQEIRDTYSFYGSLLGGATLNILTSNKWVPLIRDAAMKNKIKGIGYLLAYQTIGEIVGSVTVGNIGLARRYDEFTAAKKKDELLLLQKETNYLSENRNMIAGVTLATAAVLYGGYKLYKSYQSAESSKENCAEAQR